MLRMPQSLGSESMDFMQSTTVRRQMSRAAAECSASEGSPSPQCISNDSVATSSVWRGPGHIPARVTAGIDQIDRFLPYDDARIQFRSVEGGLQE